MFLHRQKFETQIFFITSLRLWFRSLMENEERFLDPEIQIVFFLQGFTTNFNPMASTFSDSSCGGASTTRRNPSRPYWVNHFLVISESAMGSIMSFASVVVLSVGVADWAFYVRWTTLNHFCALNALCSRNERDSVRRRFCVPIFVAFSRFPRMHIMYYTSGCVTRGVL